MIKKVLKNKTIIGVDEVGRGPLAGPVVAAAVLLRNFQFPISNFQSNHNYPIFKNIKDSKKLSVKQREEIYAEILKCTNFAFGIGEVSEKIIDKINILQATKLAMQKAIKDLFIKIGATSDIAPILVQVDGNMKFEKDWFKDKNKKSLEWESIVKGDEKIFEISCASIIAKVYRDKLMQKYAKKYPEYGFEKHKGYGSKMHFECLEKFGSCKIHRKTFYPVSKYK